MPRKEMYKIKVRIRGCKNIDSLGEFIRANNIKLVLFGEYHGFLNQVHVQRKIIQNVKPDFFLYEMLEEDKILNDKGAKRFLGKPDNKDFSFISTYGDLKPIVRLAREFNLPIIGCDIKNMCITDKGWSKRSHKEIIATFSHEEGKKMTHKRELRQSKVINKYTSKGLVFGVSGCYHVRKNSQVLSKLRDKNAIIVKPLFKWKEKFNHRKRFKNSEISYIIKM